MSKEKDTPRVFVSYAREDLPFAEKLVADLRRHSVNAWFDREIKVGQSFFIEIENALRDADYLIIILSAISVEKRWVNEEYHALWSEGKVLPVLIDEKEKINIPPLLRSRRYADFSADEKYEESFAELLLVFHGHVGFGADTEEGKRQTALTNAGPTGDGLKEQGFPLPLPALFLRSSRASNAMPLDIGMVLGLDRSSFIGVVSGCPGDEVYGGLERAEGALSHAMEAEGQLRHLSRWWTKIDPQVNPEGPKFIADIWRSQLDRDNPRFQDLRDNNLPTSAILGLFLEVTNQSHETLTMTRNWCRELVRGSVCVPQLAIVIHVCATDLDRSDELALSILDDIGDLGSTVRVEGMSLCRRPDKSRTPFPTGIATRDNLASTENGRFGIAFCSWVEKAKRSAEMNWRKDDEKRYSEVFLLFNEYKDSDVDYLVEIAATQVVAELERLEIEDLDRQFLQFIEEYLPDHIYSLVGAYARSESRQARRTALVFAAHSDFLMDAWVERNDLDPAYLPHGPDLYADPNQGSITESFAPALLRQYQRGKNRERIKTFLKTLEASSSLQAVIDLTIGDLPIDQFARNFSRREFLLALRSDARFEFSDDVFKTSDLARPDFWWLLEALPPRLSTLREILSLEAQKRAVFGLCTAEEWQLISHDKEIKRQVMGCRRERPLSFLQA